VRLTRGHHPFGRAHTLSHASRALPGGVRFRARYLLSQKGIDWIDRAYYTPAMAMGRRKDRARTPGLWIATNELPPTGGHPFYQRLNQVLDTHGFDEFVEAQCASFYAATRGRRSLTPGTYFRLLLIGYFEGIDSERGIAWRTADSLLRSIVRRDSGETYQEFLTRLAQASGIETPSRADLARLDRKRPKKGRNTEWRHPHDPDARITKMKDGRTRLAHKAEHAVDLETGAIVGVTVQGADDGDTTTIAETDEHTAVIEEVVADKGYHSNQVLVDFAALDLRTYIAEPDRGRRRRRNKTEARDAVYANRRRIRGARGRALQRRRRERLERPNAHLYETGGMRRTHLRGHVNILKRLDPQRRLQSRSLDAPPDRRRHTEGPAGPPDDDREHPRRADRLALDASTLSERRINRSRCSALASSSF
jgi:DDE family transposase